MRLLALASFTSSVLTVSVPQANLVKQASVNNGGLQTEGIETLDGVPLDAIPEGRSAPAQNAIEVPSATSDAFTVSVDSFQPGYPASNAIDGNANTFWHTEFTPTNAPLPHYIQIDMQQVLLINSISYQPRQDGRPNGNIGEHQISWSVDGKTFQVAAIGTWRDDSSTKTSVFEAQKARYVRLTALTEAGNRGPWASCAEFKVFTTATRAPAYPGVSGGEWSPTIDFPLVPVSAALEFNSGPNQGRIIVWSSYAASTFGGSSGTQTLTATFDPSTMTVSQRTVTNTQHDMFCEGLAFDANGRIISTGGNSAPKTSIFTPGSQAWSSAPNMNIARGYHAQVTCSDGRIFTIGGSWSGGTGNKNGEIYDPVKNTWTLLPGATVAQMLTADAQGVYRADNHGMLFGWKNGYVFQAGPSRAMNWYNTAGGGSVIGAGTRGNDGDAMCGDAVMYDAVAGKILTLGGAPSYQNVNSTANAHIITIGNPGTAAQVQNIGSMNYQRIFANGVALPNGNVFVAGGQVYGQPFSDDTSIYPAEIWVQATGQFVKAASISIPRNYHSVGILLADASIFLGGGGLCGACATNHYDAQVYKPGYLFNADATPANRPVINTVNGGNTATIAAGGKVTATVTGTAKTWSLMRMGVTTHTVNTDQRRVPLTATQAGNTYTMTLPADRGILIPGPWMLFAMDANGVPSIAKYILTT